MARAEAARHALLGLLPARGGFANDGTSPTAFDAWKGPMRPPPCLVADLAVRRQTAAIEGVHHCAQRVASLLKFVTLRSTAALMAWARMPFSPGLVTLAGSASE